ncbi:4-diphosphocytidyl-2-C-methyl-D-erythritol kinase [Fusobacterium sp. DD29]|uniref:4-(cytidine 5'-diphospho)-2-C-methyl-D-erythritol kinase n=1 Tax=unclassified Fusobacterium TaxID=2648384 RepID=UPI001B8C32E4|nr:MULTISPECIES: 4-(cytidine 5'-diphospho)-2-C-methyl-D-erythritol kinase [unclassified Fusobacterium]MBR8701443.1 4-diphosphocytidyl-2-C-methyl-D-erythritol kinase [Fusobacterium sp. DD45]MBR8711171.1 4-diphosphocytidyl-2-C-methyl-D-erythritol kinase [Fusobacterium sp. DD28]MBR8749666.1 4-diphosphocytidyl-2-C-methyl-D-erythritol kinase [Fusobacterium sp. DD29]MBR8751745.1 4-diphosphocytidyl-2-C-methyl-D-erythritol kinase [Fusobacterium sp. DD26]MBR8761927.1 4-diphosphocytidyl-2-C-methyl-D-ery
MEFVLNSNAKINLGLNVEGVLPNGYHLLDMVMIPVSLSDKITGEISGKPGNLKITTNIKGIPTGKENILYKIYEEFYKESGIDKHEVSLHLEKVIPHEAGLGGGSSNGAFFLNFLNSYHGNLFSMDKLIEIGKRIGADIPFFLINKPARVRGIGEKIEIIENRLTMDIIIIKPPFGVSTALAYKNMDILKNKKDANIENIIRGLRENSIELVESSIENNLEQGLLQTDTNIIEFRKELTNICGGRFFMSGSGSAYYTFVHPHHSNNMVKALREHLQHCRVYLCSGLDEYI